MERLKNLIEKWRQYVADKNPYTFGMEEIFSADFAELAKDTFEVIKSAKENHIYAKSMPEDPFAVLSYLELITLISQYTLYDNTDDESEDRIFTVTCLITQGLKDFAIGIDSIEIDQGKSTYSLTEENTSGNLWIYGDSFWFLEDSSCSEDERVKVYRYNVYDADTSEIRKLANSLK